MNGKPKNQRAALSAAFHCTHPDLDGVDAALLAYLAHNATFGTGENSHPGNRNISDVLKLCDRATDKRLKKNIDRGLIERTRRADGRKCASAYRLCWESCFYPDFTPGGEPLTDKPRTVECADSGYKPRTGEPETANAKTQNRALENLKPRTGEPETANCRVPATISTPEEHRKHTTHTPSNSHTDKIARTNPCGCVCSNLKTLNHVMAHVHTDMLASQWKHGEKEQAQQLITVHGWESFLAVEKLYWQEQDPTVFARTLFKWTAFLTSFPGWLRKVTPAMLTEQAEERWRATPAGAAEYKRMIDASCARYAEAARQRNLKSAEALEEERKRAIVRSAIERCLAGEQVKAPEEMKLDFDDSWPHIVRADPKTHAEMVISVDETTGLLVASPER